MSRAFGHRVAMCCDMLGVVGSILTIFKFEPTTPNMSQHGGQTHATCCTQQCCDMLRWQVAIRALVDGHQTVPYQPGAQVDLCPA